MKKNVVHKPLISVVMPVFNADEFLAQAIGSIHSQTYKNWELIIVDDHSTDNSWQIIQQFAQKDSRIRAYRNSRNLGTGSTANKAIRYATSNYIARMDADDISLPDRFQKQLSFLQKHPATIVAGGQCTVIDHLNQIIGRKYFPTEPDAIKKMLFTFASIQQPAMMMNTQLLPKNFAWYESKLNTTEEHELLFKLLKYGNLANLPDIVLKYRMHGKNVSLKTPKKDFYKILHTRVKAVKHHQYQPSTSAVLVNIAQLLTTTLLPTKMVYTLYALLRGLKNSGIESSQNKAKMLPSMSVFFPMHNEAKNIRQVIKQAQKVIPSISKNMRF